jgi:hypothetical protein
MGEIAKHTDLSHEEPGPRAIVDLPHEDIEFRTVAHVCDGGRGDSFELAGKRGTCQRSASDFSFSERSSLSEYYATGLVALRSSTSSLEAHQSDHDRRTSNDDHGSGLEDL